MSRMRSSEPSAPAVRGASYECGCVDDGKGGFVQCAQHYFSYSGPVEHLARAAHRATYGVGSAWWDRGVAHKSKEA